VTSGASYQTSGDQRGARPVVRATGRAETSAGRAETSAERDQWRELPDERRPARDERRPVRSETSGASYRTSRVPACPRDKRAQEGTQSGQREASGHQPAERDQWRELPDEPGASGSA